jgi:hypothetical protein
VVTPDETGKAAASISWTKTPVEGSMLTHPGVYCLRGNETTWDAETLWHTYTVITHPMATTVPSGRVADNTNRMVS